MKVKINEVASQYLTQLRSSNIVLTDAEIVTIWKLGEVATNGIEDAALLLGKGRQIGNLVIHPLSIGAKLWLLSEAQRWFVTDENLSILSVLYASANSRNPAAFDFDSAGGAAKYIKKWASKIMLTADEFDRAYKTVSQDLIGEQMNSLDALQDLIEQIRTNPNNLDMTKALAVLQEIESPATVVRVREQIAFMVYCFGGPIQDWLWGESDDNIAAYARIAQRMKLIERGDQQNVDRFDPAITALRQLDAFCKDIRRRNNG